MTTGSMSLLSTFSLSVVYLIFFPLFLFYCSLFLSCLSFLDIFPSLSSSLLFSPLYLSLCIYFYYYFFSLSLSFVVSLIPRLFDGVGRFVRKNIGRWSFTMMRSLFRAARWQATKQALDLPLNAKMQPKSNKCTPLQPQIWNQNVCHSCCWWYWSWSKPLVCKSQNIQVHIGASWTHYVSTTMCLASRRFKLDFENAFVNES